MWGRKISLEISYYEVGGSKRLLEVGFSYRGLLVVVLVVVF